MEGPHISLESTKIIEIGQFHVTNSVLASFLVTGIIFLIVIISRKKMALIPTRTQLFFEIITEFFMGMLKTAYGDEKRAKKFLPLILTLFLFLFLANQFSIIPLFTSMITEKGLVFRTPTSDWNQTMALAIIVIGMAHAIAFSIAPLKHIGNYLKIGPLLKARSLGDVGNALLDIFLGLLDIVGEFAKVISISARLFGNIFAGEVIIIVISSIAAFTAYFIPIPFIGLSMFSSLVQAFVFTLLTIFFMAGTISAVSSPASEPQKKN